MEPERNHFKVLVYGGLATGKTCFIGKHVRGYYDENTVATIGPAWCTKIEYVGDQTVFCVIGEIKGGSFRGTMRMCYSNVDAAIVVYDVTREDDLDEAKSCVEDLQKNANPEILIALVGLKADLSYARAVKYEEAKSYAEDNNFLFFEVSAKTGMNVDELFSAIVSTAWTEIPATELRQIIQIDNRGQKVLNMERRKLRRVLMAAEELNDLNVLHLSNNLLRVLPSNTCKLKQLTTLKLSHNKLTHLSPSIGDLVNLIQLVLDDNCLSSVPATIRLLRKLEELDVRDNELIEICTCIVDLKRLKTLWVEGNRLSVGEIRRLMELTNRNPKLVIDIAVVAPPEIRAQGQGAQMLYHKALRDGFVNIYRGRIFLIGQDRSGKTSLKKSLLGQPFDPKEESTDGIVVDPSKCEIDVDEVRSWHSTSKDKLGVSTFSREISKALAEKRYHSIFNSIKNSKGFNSMQLKSNLSDVKEESEKRSEEEPRRDESIITTTNVTESESKSPLAESQTTEESDASTRSEAESKAASEVVKSPQNLKEIKERLREEIQSLEETATESEKRPIFKVDATSSLDDVQGHADELLKYMLLNGDGDGPNSEDSIVTVDLWDFAGQHLYYATHPIFLSSRAVYVLVHNLSKPLDALAEPCVRQGTHDIRLENSNGETNLENLLSWLVTVHRMKPKEEEIAENTGRKRSYLRPPVFIVGTHADKPFDEPNTMTSQIQQRISGQEYESHVIRPFFTVDNTQSKQSLWERMKQLFAKLPPRRQTEEQDHGSVYRGEGIDALRVKIMEVLRQEPYMGEKIPVRWLEFEKVIEGLVSQNIYHMSVDQLQGYARDVCLIEDADEFHTMLKFYHDLGLIVRHQSTVVLKSQWLIDFFRHLITIPCFDEVEPLHAKYWKEVENSGLLSMELVDHVFSKFIQHSVAKEDILDMMEQFSLISKFSSLATGAKYFVPAQLKSPPDDLCQLEPSRTDPCPLYISFVDGFVPHGLFTRLVSRSVSWCSKTWRTPLPNLYQNGASFVLISGQIICDFILLCKKSYIKIALRQRNQEEVVSLDEPVDVARDVRDFIEDTIQTLSHEMPYLNGLQYQLCAACPCCRHECSKYHQVPCAQVECLHLLAIKPEELQPICQRRFCDRVHTVRGLRDWFCQRANKELRPSAVPGASQGEATQSDRRTSDNVLKVTLLASEWGSSMGGLSTINRTLAILMAKHPKVDVTLLIPECSCCEEDKRAAERHNIVIREAQSRPGYTDPLDWLSSPPRNLVIDVVLGHGAKLGRQAQFIRESHHCKWVQVVHTAPEELGMYKNYPRAIATGEEKNKAEVDLCKLADLVVAVGPKLAEAYSAYLRSCKKHQDIIQLTPGIFCEFSSTAQATQEGNKFRILTFGRGDPEDFSLKGYDIAAKAVAELKDRSYRLVFVGAPKGKQEEVTEILHQSGISRYQLTVRTFVESKERLKELFCEVDLAIMPSRTEGFGLTALEALSAGLPILVSCNSGFGEALRELPFGESCVVESDDPVEWAKAIKSVRQNNRAQRLQEIQILRTNYEEKYSWDEQCETLVKKMLTMVST